MRNDAILPPTLSSDRTTNDELREAATEASLLSEARGEAPPVIIIQQNGIDQDILAAGAAIIALASAAVWLMNRTRRNRRKREDTLD
jgi:hypothetical protein